MHSLYSRNSGYVQINKSSAEQIHMATRPDMTPYFEDIPISGRIKDQIYDTIDAHYALRVLPCRYEERGFDVGRDTDH